MTAEHVIETLDLSRDFGKSRVVDQVNFQVPEGSVTGLIGRNGAGKTTLIKLLLGLLRPTEGSSTVFGDDSMSLSRPTRRRVGYLSEDPLPFDHLNVSQLFRYVSAFFDDWDWSWSQKLVDRLDLSPSKPLDDMSTGQRRRAELAVVLAQQPDLLILDDPAVGLDATIRKDFLWAALETTREEGKSVLLTSHILHDVERAVDRVGLLAGGRLIECRELDEFKARTKRVVFEGDLDRLPDVLPGQVSRVRERDAITVVTKDFCDSWFEPLSSQCQGSIEDLNLEEIFISLTGSEEE